MTCFMAIPEILPVDPGSRDIINNFKARSIVVLIMQLLNMNNPGVV